MEGTPNTHIKRGPAFKGHLIPAIMNTAPNGDKFPLPVDSDIPIKFQTRRFSQPNWEPRDFIAIREPFRLGRWYPDQPVVEVRYQEDKHGKYFEQPGCWVRVNDPKTLKRIQDWKEPSQMKPGMFMPSGFHRITAKVTEVRCERLKDISAEDAIAEGIASKQTERGRFWKDYLNDQFCFTHPIPSFRSLWRSIHGLDSWEVNPKVWMTAWNVTGITLCTRGKLLCETDSLPSLRSPLARCS